MLHNKVLVKETIFSVYELYPPLNVVWNIFLYVYFHSLIRKLNPSSVIISIDTGGNFISATKPPRTLQIIQNIEVSRLSEILSYHTVSQISGKISFGNLCPMKNHCNRIIYIKRIKGLQKRSLKYRTTSIKIATSNNNIQCSYIIMFKL